MLLRALKGEDLTQGLHLRSLRRKKFFQRMSEFQPWLYFALYQSWKNWYKGNIPKTHEVQNYLRNYLLYKKIFITPAHSQLHPLTYIVNKNKNGRCRVSLQAGDEERMHRQRYQRLKPPSFSWVNPFSCATMIPSSRPFQNNHIFVYRGLHRKLHEE